MLFIRASPNLFSKSGGWLSDITSSPQQLDGGGTSEFCSRGCEVYKEKTCDTGRERFFLFSLWDRCDMSKTTLAD
jgi:hypothetical protein